MFERGLERESGAEAISGSLELKLSVSRCLVYWLLSKWLPRKVLALANYSSSRGAIALDNTDSNSLYLLF